MPSTTLTPRQAQANLGFPDQHWLACPRHQLLICAIPKNGCTTLKRWFLSFSDPAGLTAPDVHAYCADHSVISLWPGPDRDAAFSSFEKMAFLRDPLSRIASAFVEKFVGGHPYGLFEPARELMEDLARLRGSDVKLDQVHTITSVCGTLEVPASAIVDYARGITFREFVHYLCRAPDAHLDVHWRPQCCYFWRHRIDRLGVVAELSRTLEEFAAERGLPPPPVSEPLARDEIGSVCLSDVPSGELYQRYVYERACLPPVAALYDDDLRSLLACRYSLDADLYDLAGRGKSVVAVSPSVPRQLVEVGSAAAGAN